MDRPCHHTPQPSEPTHIRMRRTQSVLRVTYIVAATGAAPRVLDQLNSNSLDRLFLRWLSSKHNQNQNHSINYSYCFQQATNYSPMACRTVTPQTLALEASSPEFLQSSLRQQLASRSRKHGSMEHTRGKVVSVPPHKLLAPPPVAMFTSL